MGRNGATMTDIKGFCYRCHRVWTLAEAEGKCQWCGRVSYRTLTTSKPRSESQRRHKKQPESRDIGEGYDQLPEPYLTYYRVAMRFAHKAMTGDKDDLLHSIIEGLAKVANHKADKGEDFTEPAMHRTAEHIKDHYWYKHYAYTNGLSCRNCSKEQQAKCRYNWAHSDWAYSDCHRAMHLESLNQPITDGEGNTTELAELIADDKALDLAEWVDVRTFLIGAPIRLKSIAMKRSKGETLTGAERKYLTKLRKKTQLSLTAGVTF